MPATTSFTAYSLMHSQNNKKKKNNKRCGKRPWKRESFPEPQQVCPKDRLSDLWAGVALLQAIRGQCQDRHPFARMLGTGLDRTALGFPESEELQADVGRGYLLPEALGRAEKDGSFERQEFCSSWSSISLQLSITVDKQQNFEKHLRLEGREIQGKPKGSPPGSRDVFHSAASCGWKQPALT